MDGIGRTRAKPRRRSVCVWQGSTNSSRVRPERRSKNRSWEGQPCAPRPVCALNDQFVAAFRTQTGLFRHSNRSLFASRNRAGKRFGEARDWAGIFGDIGQFCVTETAPSRVCGGKATESQRLFRWRQETGIAQDCVVAEAVPFGPVSVFFSLPNREKNREFREIQSSGATWSSFPPVHSTACDAIP